jgi:hypothetical protein
MKNEKLKKQIAVLIIIGAILALTINIFSILLHREIGEAYATEIVVERKTLEEKIEEVEKRELEAMDLAIYNASIEFDVPEWLILGIANAESAMGKSFAHSYDFNCHNWWGLKGGNMTKRQDGSYLRCFISDEAGARTVAKTLRLYYLDEGRDTPEKICQKWIGSTFANVEQDNGYTHCENWVYNVNQYNK